MIRMRACTIHLPVLQVYTQRKHRFTTVLYDYERGFTIVWENKIDNKRLPALVYGDFLTKKIKKDETRKIEKATSGKSGVQAFRVGTVTYLFFYYFIWTVAPV